MRLACIVLAYHLPEHLARLVSSLRHPQVNVYLHIDSRKRLRPFKRAFADAGLSDVALLPRHPSRWGSAECVDAILEGISAGVADRCDYFLLISGQDFPLRPTGEIVEFFGANPRNYIESFELPTPRWRYGGRYRTDFYTYDLFGRRETCIPRGEDTSYLSWKGHLLNGALRLRTLTKPRRRFPSYAQPVGGSQWWNLNRDAAEYVLRFVGEHPDYRRYHEHTLLPDELFFQSILLGTDFARHHEVVNDSLRFMRWPPDATHPRVLTLDDLREMLASENLFARKFDPGVDATVIDRLVERASA